MTAAMGLLDGLGFSFVLSDILPLEAPHLMVSLVSFNIGVEIAQVAVVPAVWPALFWLGRRWQGKQRAAVVAVASLAIAVALYWTFERAAVLGPMVTA